MNSKFALGVLVFGIAGQLLAAETPPAGDIATLEEVVITAQKRTERLQDVPVSASVVTSETVNRLNAGDISDLNRLVPSVNLNGTINGRVPMGMRGVASVSNEGAVGVPSGVAIMIDGVPVPPDSRAGNALEDVQAIEVLKGPQATLGGRTAAAGVINIVTRKPSDVLTGVIGITATSDSEYRANGYIAGPISNAVDYSLAAYYTSRDFPVKNLRLNKITNQKISGARGKLLFKPDENLDITLTARVGRDNSDGFNFVYTHLSPGIHLLTGAGGPPFLDQSVLLPGITANFDNQVYSSPVNAFSTVKDTDFSLDLQYRRGGLTFGSTTAYMHEVQVNVQDLFAVDNFFWNLLTGAGSGAPGTPPPFYNFQRLDIDVKQVSQEFKIASDTDRTVSYLAGLFYSDTKVDLTQDRQLLGGFDNYNVKPDTKTTDLYGRITWKLQPSTSLVVGLRYNKDELSYVHNQFLYTAVGPGPANPPVIFGAPFGPNVPVARGSSSESTPVGDLSLQHKFSDDTMAYVTYARGYAPAAYNTANKLTLATDPMTTGAVAPTPANLSDDLAKKESIDHFELGTKGQYMGRRLTFNAALFDTKYKNFQIQIFDQNNTSINPPLILSNAGGAETKGLEIDTAFAATDHLRLDLNMAYTDAKFTDYRGAPCYYPAVPGAVPAGCTRPVAGGAIVQDLSGKTMPNAPKLKYTLSAEQRIPLANAGDVVLAGNYTYRDSVQMLTDQNPYTIQPSLGILNLSIGFRTADGKKSVTLFANNVTDKHYFTDLEDFWSAPWGGSATVVGQPARDTNRYFGVRLSAGF